MRYAARSLWQSRKSTSVVVCTLAVAVAVVTTVLSALNAYAWRTLPYHDPERIVAVGVEYPAYGRQLGSVQRPDLMQLRDMDDIFTKVAGYAVTYPALRSDGPAYRARTIAADEHLLPLLGAGIVRGRVLTAEAEDIAVLSHAAWLRRFGGNDAIIGSGLYVDGRVHTVVGVLREQSAFENAEVFVPLHSAARDLPTSVLARLAPGVSATQAASRLEGVPLQGAYSDAVQGLGLSDDMVQRDSITRAGALPWVFLGATVLLLLAACANVVSILMARTIAKEQQNAVRAALGASRRQLLSESLLESFLLAALASLIGLVLCIWILRALPALLPGELPSWIRLAVDVRVLAVTAGVGLLVMTMVGLLPARYASLPNLQLLMKSGAAAGRMPHQVVLTRRLVIFEVAVSVALFVSTLLLVRSHGQATRVDPGFPARQILAMDVHLLPEITGREAVTAEYLREAVQRLSQHPGVAAASWMADDVSLRDESGAVTRSRIWVARPDAGRVPPRTQSRAVGPGYFGVVQIPIVAGRAFTDHDGADMPLVAVVSREFARRAWPDADGTVVGRSLVVDSVGGSRTATVVGVAADHNVIYGSRAGSRSQPVPMVYLSGKQVGSTAYTLLAYAPNPEIVQASALASLRALQPDVPVEDVGTLWTRMRTGFAERIFAILFGAIGAASLLLALIGLYGIVSYSAQQRTREYGIRIALGASPNRVALEVMAGGLTVTLWGLLGGAFLAFGIAQFIRRLLFGVSTLDPVIYLAVGILFTGVSLLAAYLPGRRAMKVDPAVALRAE